MPRMHHNRKNSSSWNKASPVISEPATFNIRFACGHIGFATLSPFLTWEIEEIKIVAEGEQCPACQHKKSFDYNGEYGAGRITIWGYARDTPKEAEDDAEHSDRKIDNNDWVDKPKKGA